MPTRTYAGFVGLIMLLSAGFSEAEDAGRVEPLDGRQGLNERNPLLPRNPQAPPSTAPQGDPSSRLTTPFGTPMPPNQVTPAPVLPFNPNGSLMPNRPLMPAAAASRPPVLAR
jgi:hypothetical protein